MRVWVSGDTDRVLPIVRGLISQQIDARSGLDEIADLGEAGAIRWADVVVVTTRGPDLSTAEAFIAGVAVGAQRPLVFLGPMSVQASGLPAATHTLLEPIPSEALAFQLDALGRKLANKRRPRQKTDQRTRALQHKPVSVSRQGELHSDLERRVYEQLVSIESVSEVVLGSAEQSLLSAGDNLMLTDFMIWMDSAQPFNPIPVEAKGTSNPRAFDQIFRFLAASRSMLGVLITDDQAPPQTVERDGRIVVAISLQDVPRLVELIRAARNALVHGNPQRG